MHNSKIFGVAGVFGLFQGAMPFIGWFCVHTLASAFEAFQKFIPWIALALLGYIGGKMLIEGIEEYKCREGGGGDTCPMPQSLTLTALLVQGVATSIDALSVGFTISEYGLFMAVVCALIIAVVTFIICMIGIFIGKKMGTKLAGKANILGGIIFYVWYFIE
jgi:putative Mn2+ efflux pump MntP